MSDFMNDWPLTRTTDVSVPRRMERMLEALGADTEFRDAVLGDLAEEFAIRLREDGEREARSWYCREGLRVAPYLVRDWWRGLRGRDVVGFAGVVALSAAALNVFEVATRVALHVGFLAVNQRSVWEAMSELGDARPIFFQAMMLAWTFVDGLFGGYVAARLHRRAPMMSALALGAVFTVFMLLTTVLLVGPSPIALAFRTVNIAALLAGIITGGMASAGRVSERGDIFPAKAAHLDP